MSIGREEKREGEDMRILFAYYSRGGVTRKLAQAAATALEADMEEIISVKKMTGVIGFFRGARGSITGRPAHIRPLQASVESYDLLFLGSPVWAGKLSSPALGFLNQYTGKIKRLSVFLTHADANNPYDTIFKEIERMSGNKLDDALSFTSADVKADRFDLDRFRQSIHEI